MVVKAVLLPLLSELGLHLLHQLRLYGADAVKGGALLRLLLLLLL
jgi:hypothetical protein